ncbi:MAG: sigma-54 dependent transcriptional regulator [Myxococcota bacterium]
MVATRFEHPDIEVFHGMLTVAPSMKRLFRLIERVARTDFSILLRGETGTGKDLVARALHAMSARHAKPFLGVNCATFTVELLASELFGHVRGAFTGAVSDRQGLFARADGGTLFLDEVAEIDLAIQSRLLRVLEERKFVPVGGTVSEEVDVRIMAATHKALRAEVEAGRFRDDLMYRIRVVPIFLPPLRERAGDVEALAWHFIARLNEKGLRQVEAMDDNVRAAMLRHPWPGNVRELRNVLEYAFAVGEGPRISLDELTPELRGEPPKRRRPRSAAERERERLHGALQASGGRKGDAARALGMSRSTFWRKCREHGVG